MNDKDNNPTVIECGRCGSRFSYELLRCPHCGASVYEPEFDELPDMKPIANVPLGTAARVVGRELLSKSLIIVWWLISSILSILFYIGFRPLIRGAPAFLILSLVYICVAFGSLAGGFLAGRFARTKPKWDGLMVGLLGLSGVLALIAYEFGDLGRSLLSWVSLLGCVLVIGAGWFGAFIASRLKRQEIAEALFERPVQITESDEHGLYYELLLKVNFEDEVAERLIEHEGRQRPKARRVELIEAAIQRWERDNRT